MQNSQIQKLKSALTKVYSRTGDELCGVVNDNQLVLLANVAVDSHCSFMFAVEDIIEWMDGSEATWHTHPGAPSNLSGADYDTFIQWPDHYHFIVGEDGVRCYKFDDLKNALVEVDDE